MALAGAFIGGAKGRLLPASVPFRFFGAAVAFHLLAWLALAAGAAQFPGFAGGPGWPLAALHLVTLGVLAMTAMGAGAQLLPVATRQSAPGARALLIVWWLFVPSVLAVALGMGLPRPAWLLAGAAGAALALGAWALLVARHLLGARGMPGVVLHGWGALAALAAALVSALAVVAAWNGFELPALAAWLALHRLLAPFGFMGLLALGLAYILVPMFALAHGPAERQQLAAGGAALAALLAASLAAFGVAPLALRLAAWTFGAVAVALHLRLMVGALRSGMRRELGRSFVLVKAGWTALAASLLLALPLALEVPQPWLAPLFGLLVVGGWLLSFLLGMLERIAPFLAAMHGSGGRRGLTPSALTHEGALRLHLGCHFGALALLALAQATGLAALALAGATVGALGAVAFGFFFVTLLKRLRAGAA